MNRLKKSVLYLILTFVVGLNPSNAFSPYLNNNKVSSSESKIDLDRMNLSENQNPYNPSLDFLPKGLIGVNALLSTTVFTESMGTPTGTTLIPVYETANGFDNDGYTMSGSADVRATTPSTGYAGASGSGNVFITNTVGKNFIISGINTSGLTNLQLSFGINKSSLTGDGSDLLVQVSANGTAYTNLTFPALPTGNGTAGSIWNY